MDVPPRPGLGGRLGDGLILGYLMYRSGLVPQPMTWLGLIGGPMIIASGTAVMFAGNQPSNREHAARLHRGICGKTVGLDDATVQDACAIAWERLLGRPDIDLERYEAYWWLYKVALRRAWALGRRRRREQPISGLNGADVDSLEPVDLDSDVADVVAERIEHASMREVLGRLHWRERRELALIAYGLSYEEIATVTGTSYTAVNRWMARGRNALRAADVRRHLSDDDPDGPER